jgi:hypothetical protein
MRYPKSQSHACCAFFNPLCFMFRKFNKQSRRSRYNVILTKALSLTNRRKRKEKRKTPSDTCPPLQCHAQSKLTTHVKTFAHQLSVSQAVVSTVSPSLHLFPSNQRSALYAFPFPIPFSTAGFNTTQTHLLNTL